MADPDRLLLAVLIDADNVPAAHGEAIMKEIAALGEPALRRVFGDWTNPALQNGLTRSPNWGWSRIRNRRTPKARTPLTSVW